jgi:hypothetical protein
MKPFLHGGSKPISADGRFQCSNEPFHVLRKVRVMPVLLDLANDGASDNDPVGDGGDLGGVISRGDAEADHHSPKRPRLSGQLLIAINNSPTQQINKLLRAQYSPRLTLPQVLPPG